MFIDKNDIGTSMLSSLVPIGFSNPMSTSLEKTHLNSKFIGFERVIMAFSIPILPCR